MLFDGDDGDLICSIMLVRFGSMFDATGALGGSGRDDVLDCPFFDVLDAVSSMIVDWVTVEDVHFYCSIIISMISITCYNKHKG